MTMYSAPAVRSARPWPDPLPSNTTLQLTDLSMPPFIMNLKQAVALFKHALSSGWVQRLDLAGVKTGLKEAGLN